MFSMSCGLIKLSGLELCWLVVAPLLGVLPVSKGTPSTIYKGWEDVENELAPRMTILMPPPGAPSLWLTCTPAILPCMPWAISMAPPFIRSLPASELNEPLRSLFFMVP